MNGARKPVAQDLIAGQIGLMVASGVFTVSEAREAVELLADDDRFWAFIPDVLHATETRLPELLCEAEHTADTRERNKRGLS